MKIVLFLTLVFLSALPAYAAEPIVLDKGYIKQDTTWSGTVILKGQNVVKRGVTLTVLPGTVVKFPFVDEDGDNIGDGELTVEGTLKAKGTKEMPILFTSGQERPKMKDWTFVQISVSKESAVEYCIFEYAFSGLQVHYSAATVKNCVFRKNFEGMRFSTAVVNIENNTFIGNDFGIRYEARGSRVRIRKNEITGNGCGFFAVTRCDGANVLIEENNIVSSGYNFKLGALQKGPLSCRDNWWGTADEGAIAASIMDGRSDDELGVVDFGGWKAGPIKGCGVE